MEFFLDIGALPIPGELFGQFGVAAGQLLETSMSVNRFANELQLLGTDALAVVGPIFVSLKGKIGTIRGGARTTLGFESLLAEMAADHGVNTSDFLEDVGALLLDGG